MCFNLFCLIAIIIINTWNIVQIKEYKPATDDSIADMLNRVLCVEDDPLLQSYYRRMMERVSFAQEIVQLYNGQQALDYCSELAESGPDPEINLIFLDLEMPVLGGRSFLREFEERFMKRFTSTRIVILTSALCPELRKKAGSHPLILEYLNKPLTFRILTELQARLASAGS